MKAAEHPAHAHQLAKTIPTVKQDVGDILILYVIATEDLFEYRSL